MDSAGAAVMGVGFAEDTDSFAAGVVALGAQRCREEKRDLGSEGFGMIVVFVGFEGSAAL